MSLPTTMKAIGLHQAGGPEEMYLAELPLPEPESEEVLIRVRAAGVNRPDLLQREGRYPPPPGASPIMGLEISGEIVRIGSQVTQWRCGDLVCALVPGGGYAEFAVAHQGLCLPIPAGVSLEDAAGLPETYLTVWSNVFEIGRIQPGETLLVHGGSSGIGTSAIQLAHAKGAQVLTTAGTEEKCGFCEKLGASLAIQYRQQDFETEVLRYTDGRGVDVILDMVGGDYFPRNIRLLAPKGRLVQIAFLQGTRAEVDFTPLLSRHIIITGSTLRPRSPEEKARLAQEVRAHVWPLFPNHLRPLTFQQFPLAEAAGAHRLMQRSDHTGKLLLLP